MSPSNSTSPYDSRLPRPQFFAYRPSSDGVDHTFEIYCLETDLTVATFNFWNARESCRRWAGQLAAALNALYENGGHVRVSEFVTVHQRLNRKYCRDTIVHHATGEPLIASFDDYEIRGVRLTADGGCECVADDEAQFWSLYGYRDQDEHIQECIGDYPTRNAAEEIYARITGWFYRPRRQPQAAVCDTTAIHSNSGEHPCF